MPTPALFSGLHRTAVACGETATVASQTYFFCCARKVGKKMRRRRVILRADAREFLAAPRPERPLRAQNCDYPDSLWFRQMYYTHLRADCINFASAHFRNTRPVTILHHRRIRRWPAISTAGCFASFLRGSDSRWERCPHAGGAVVQLCREIPVCWPQCFSTGLFSGLRYNPIRI